MAKSKKPSPSTVDQINWWKDGNDIHVAEGTMFVVHKITARLFEARIGWHHFQTCNGFEAISRILLCGKLKECKAHVEQLWADNYVIATPCPRGWDNTETPYLDEAELIEAALEGALDDQYEVVVGNVGTVYIGASPVYATKHFNEYVEQSRSGIGRAGHELVTMFKNGEIVSEYIQADDDSDDDGTPFPRNDDGGRDTPLPLQADPNEVNILSYPNEPALPLCQCRDSECICGGTCRQPAPDVLYRTDIHIGSDCWEDTTGIPMCEECSEDALPSGIYSYCPPFTNEGELLLAGILETLDDDEPADLIKAVWDRFDGPKPSGESTLDRIADVIVLSIGLIGLCISLAWSVVGLA